MAAGVGMDDRNLRRLLKISRSVTLPAISPGDADLVRFALRRVARDMAEAAAETERFVTAEEGKRGGYKKGRFSWLGLPITIETPAGAFRRGPGWSSEVMAHYGEVEGTAGADGDPVDVFMRPEPERSTCLVIFQVDPHTREFDEHKVMLGWADAREALDTYAAAFSDGLGHQRIGGSKEMTLVEFGEWLAADGARKDPFAGGALAKAFDESKIRRDEDGRFTFKDAAGVAAGVAAVGAAVVGAREGAKAHLRAARREFRNKARDFYGRAAERGGLPVFRGAPKLDPNPKSRVYDAVFVTTGRSHAQQYAGGKGAVSAYILDRGANIADVASPTHRAMSAVNLAAEMIEGGETPKKAIETAKNVMMSAAARNVMDDAHFDPTRAMIDASLKRGVHGSSRYVKGAKFRGRAIALYQPSRHLRFLGAAPKSPVVPVAARLIRRALMLKFDESKVKRDEDGKFTFKDGAAASASGVAATVVAAAGAREVVKARVATERRAFLKGARDFYGRFHERGGRPVFRGAPVLDPSPVPQKHNAVYVTSSRRAARAYASAVGGGTSSVLISDKKNPGRVSSYILSRATKTAHVLDDPTAFAAAQGKLARDIAAGKASFGVDVPAGTAVGKAVKALQDIGRVDFFDRKYVRAGQWAPDKAMIARLSSVGISGTHARDFMGREFALYNTKGLRFLGEALAAPRRPSGWARALRTVLRVR